MRCGANDQCLERGKWDDREDQGDLEEQYDRYNIYAGRWHEECWLRFGYGDFVFDESYAGERLEED